MPDKDQMPDVVYHYTSMSTLLNIVERKQLWATSVEHLNDVEERRLLIDRLLQHLPAYLKRRSADVENAFSSFNASNRLTDTVLMNLPFVTSFSVEPDSLNQWRAYCREGNGVSIGFDVRALQRATVAKGVVAGLGGESIETISMSFAPVRYRSVMKVSETDNILDGLFQEAKNLSEGNSSWSISDAMLYVLERNATLYKHASFSDEGEYRLAASGIWFQWDALSFRSSRLSLVPYLELDIPRSATADEFSQWGAIKEIYIGPTADAELTKRSLEAFFVTRGEFVKIKTTSSPFRLW